MSDGDGFSLSGGGGSSGGGVPVLTPGSIPFANGAGALTEDNAHLFWDATNGRLGVGTNAPDTLLELIAATFLTLHLRSLTNVDDIRIHGSALSMDRYDLIAPGANNHLYLRNLSAGIADIILFPKDGTKGVLRVCNDGTVRVGAFADNNFDIRTGSLVVSTHDVANPTTAPSDLKFIHAHIQVGMNEAGVNSYRTITFGWCNTGGNFAPGYIAFQETTSTNFTAGDLIFGTRATDTDVQPTEQLRIRKNGTLCVHGTTGTGVLHLPAGTAAAGTAPIKLDPGVLLTTPEVGALEFIDNGTTGHLYITVNVAGVATRVQLA